MASAGILALTHFLFAQLKRRGGRMSNDEEIKIVAAVRFRPSVQKRVGRRRPTAAAMCISERNSDLRSRDN